MMEVLGAVGGVAGLVAFFLWLLKTGIEKRLDTTLRRVAEVDESRRASYSVLWGHTASLNLFGPAEAVRCEELAEKLKDWYFADGWTLTQAAKDRYFLVQEALSFALLKSLTLRRPSDEDLYGKPKLRALDALRAERKKYLGIEPPAPNSGYTLSDLASVLDGWKSDVIASPDARRSGENGWLVLQLLLSASRSWMAKELGSRQDVRRGLL